MSDDDPEAYAATPAAELARQIMDSRIPKSEREWWASREITRLTELLALTPTMVTADELLEEAAKIADELHVMRLPIKDGDCCNHTNACGTASAIRELKGRFAIPSFYEPFPADGVAKAGKAYGRSPFPLGSIQVDPMAPLAICAICGAKAPKGSWWTARTPGTRTAGLYRICTMCASASAEAQARLFAIRAHGAQTYGDGGAPYIVHLDEVFKVACDLEAPPVVRVAAYLHDVLEDTSVSAIDLAYTIGHDVESLVQVVTNRCGKNRRERHMATYPEIRAYGSNAVLLKLCDRIANVRASLREAEAGKEGHLKMYADEHAAFRAALYCPREHDKAWTILDAIFAFYAVGQKVAHE